MRKILIITSILAILILLFISVSSHIQVSFYPIVKNIEKNNILYKTRSFNTIETVHFSVRYTDKDEYIAKITGEELEKYYNEVCSKLNHFPEGKISVIIYNKGDELVNTIKLKTETPPLGAYCNDTIHILSPYEWVEDTENIEKVYRETGPAVHEFTHLIVDEKTRGNYPMWLTEGISLYMENVTIGFSWEAGKGETDRITVEDLNDNFDGVKQEVAYRKSFEVVKDVLNEYGFDKLNMLLDSLGKGNDIENSVKVALKINFKDMD